MPNRTAKGQSPLELGPDVRPCLGAPPLGQHEAQKERDAEPRVPSVSPGWGQHGSKPMLGNRSRQAAKRSTSKSELWVRAEPDGRYARREGGRNRPGSKRSPGLQRSARQSCSSTRRLVLWLPASSRFKVGWLRPRDRKSTRLNSSHE